MEPSHSVEDCSPSVVTVKEELYDNHRMFLNLDQQVTMNNVPQQSVYQDQWQQNGYVMSQYYQTMQPPQSSFMIESNHYQQQQQLPGN